MNLGRCPVCHSRISLEACVQDEAGRELLGILAGIDSPLAAPLLSYIGLFRAPNRDLANERAVRLLRETLELCPNRTTLMIALAETVESLRSKGGAALKNHNYLKRVLESAPDTAVATISTATGKPLTSKTAAALMALQEPGA